MNRAEFFTGFGGAIRRHRAAVFVGAGVSQGSGYPSWDALLKPLREAADVPDSVTDATVAAEYAREELTPAKVEKLMLEQFRGVTGGGNDALKELLSIDVTEIWTTNFDTLIEDSSPNLERIVCDDDYARNETNAASRRLTKLHGSLGQDAKGEPTWLGHPVFTRSDFETFERDHPLMWAMLRAQFLTSSFLFLGFSFTDPNALALLRIVRSLPSELRRMPHYAVMRRPEDSDAQLRAFRLFVKDLEHAGIFVIVIDDFDEVPALLRAVARNALPPNLFISGKSECAGENGRLVRELGAVLAKVHDDIALMSFDGSSARAVARFFREARGTSNYHAENIRNYYRRSPTEGSKLEVPRIGTAIFTDLNLDDMRDHVFGQTRALLFVGDGTRALEEIEMALEHQIPVVPLPRSGAGPRNLWERGAQSCGFLDCDDADQWVLLDSADPSAAAAAAGTLLKRALGVMAVAPSST